ncbi:hypothetical protein M8J75_005855 [Diaphorina citri]|nr:hypothetical protein M8J75_005855 [Diaphorina citri]
MSLLSVVVCSVKTLEDTEIINSRNTGGVQVMFVPSLATFLVVILSLLHPSTPQTPAGGLFSCPNDGNKELKVESFLNMHIGGYGHDDGNLKTLWVKLPLPRS